MPTIRNDLFVPSHVFSQIIHTGWLEVEALAEQNEE